jgi:hypothetical protein
MQVFLADFSCASTFACISSNSWQPATQSGELKTDFRIGLTAWIESHGPEAT